MTSADPNARGPSVSDVVQVVAAILSLIVAFIAAKTFWGLVATIVASSATLVLCVRSGWRIVGLWSGSLVGTMSG